MPVKKSKSKPKTKTKAKAKPTKATVRVSIESAAVQPGASLPRGAVTLAPAGLKINVQKLSRALMNDQRARMVSSMGCVSNPGGPSC